MVNKHEPPKASKGDIAHSTAKAALGAVPFAGTLLVEVFEKFITAPLSKRREQWMAEIGQAVSDLESKYKIPFDQLQENDAFVDIVLEASQIALKASSERKREALKNAILNSALPSSPDDALNRMFLNFIENFTDWHLKFLDVLEDPKGYLSKNNLMLGSIMMGSLSNLIFTAFPELEGKNDFCDLILSDLHDNKLVGINSMKGMMSADGITAKRTTEIGDIFLGYIREPS